VRAPAFVAGWWDSRSLRVRITIVVGGVAMVALGALAWLTTGLIGVNITRAVDVELARAAAVATGKLAAGVPEDSVMPADDAVDGVSGQIAIRVTDTQGRALDDGPPLRLAPAALRELAAGDSVTVPGRDGPTRWLGVVATAPDGSPRLVLAAADLVGYPSVLRRGAIGLGLAALLAGLGVVLATWIAVRLALRPVDRMRSAAISLPPGERLPVPVPHDELRALALELNDLLARRDAASARLARFTGDAAHELRSPVAAIRAQAEVAVMHPDPELADETLRSVATEAARISELVSDLLALARADAGARPPATPVDVVAETRKAITRAETAALDLAVAAAGQREALAGRLTGTLQEAEPVGGEHGDIDPEGVESDVDAVDDPAGDPAEDLVDDPTDGSADDSVDDDSAGEDVLPPVITLTAPVPVTAAASPGELALVLDNLLTNARRYARTRIWVSVLPAGRMARLLVEDDGPGVPEADRARVFDRFTRLEADRGGLSGGAGLGLALVAALMAGRGGTVWMAASPHGGARVEARWPAAERSGPAGPATGPDAVDEDGPDMSDVDTPDDPADTRTGADRADGGSGADGADALDGRGAHRGRDASRTR
jgi:two-component system, OmpR family, sensor kinase